MAASLKKDFYLILGYCRNLMVVSLAFMLIPYLFGDTDSNFYAIYPRMFTGMIPLTLYTYDEREHYCSYCATLPISRKTYVLGKYMLGILLAAVMMILGLVLDTVFGAMGKATVELSVGMGLAMSLLAPAFTMPFVFWLGAEKGRTVYLIGIAMFSSASVVLFKNVSSLSTLRNAGLLVSVTILYALSALLSVALYSKREL